MYSFGVAVRSVTISNIFFGWTTTLIAVPHMNEKMELNLLLLHGCYKKLAFQWLNEALCFVSSFVVADSLVLRNRQLLVAANRYKQP